MYFFLGLKCIGVNNDIIKVFNVWKNIMNVEFRILLWNKVGIVGLGDKYVS